MRANWWVLESFRFPEPKNVWFPLSRHDVRRVHDTYHVLESFRPTEPKNVWFHFLDMMYVEFIKNFFLADSRELMGVRVISVSWAQKRLIPTF